MKARLEKASGGGRREKAPGEGLAEKAPGEGRREKAPGEGRREKAPGGGRWEKAPGEGRREKAPGRGSPRGGLRRRPADEGSNAQEGRVKRLLGFVKNESERREPPCPHVLGII